MSKSKAAAKPTFEERYKVLNKAQKEAVDAIDGPIMVIAGPGSGKTELLSLRVGNILKRGTARASNILCLTFTETATRNMRERLETLIGPDSYRVAIYTFHSFCTDIIGRYPEYFYNGGHFKPASELVQSEILESIFKKLPHKHILGSYHSERGYSYLKEAQNKIRDIKKGGLTPERFRELLKENEGAFDVLNAILVEHLPERIGKDSVVSFEKMKLAFEKSKTNLGLLYSSTISNALERADTEGKTTPLSAWKSKYTVNNEKGERVFKDFLHVPKLYALTDVYEHYQDALLKEGYFDYEDMILQVVEALKNHITLRTELEEMYQYILVDEFQDTNNAQLSLVKAISSNPVHEGHPNVCVVGDDDQAVYKFQGAEISNIANFKKLYKDVRTIVLTENYRSTQKVLDFARAIVLQGVNRLENTFKEVRKDLVAKNKTLPKGEIHTLSFDDEVSEYAYVAEQIKKALKQGCEAKEIAIIAREHKQLIRILPYLDKASISYSYEREENVFDEQHVRELVTLCRYLGSVGDTNITKDDLLPEILSFSFWGLDRIDIWTIAEHAKREHVLWLSAMQQSSNKKIQQIATFLIELGISSQTLPLEIVLDALIGSKERNIVSESPDDDGIPYEPRKILTTSFTSPYKEFYFGKNALKDNPSSYIQFLSSLRVFIGALREWKDPTTTFGKKIVRARDVGVFVDMHTTYKIPLTNKTVFAHNENAVSLLTSHKAKGLEFSYVFVISVNDDIWAGKGRGSLIAFPLNIALSTLPDDEDDFIRLLFVAITRSRHTLYITHHEEKLRFLMSSSLPDTNTEKGDIGSLDLLAHGLSVYHVPPFARDEKALLKKVVDGYMLSPTHLNNFLDLKNGGPLLFLEQNLLSFPQAKSPSAVYGTAFHKAIEDLHILTKQTKKVPSFEKMVDSFRKELSRGKLADYDEEKFLRTGERALASYYETVKGEICATDKTELNFSNQSVNLAGALLKGKIDKVMINQRAWSVIDFKTGDGFDDWEEKKLSIYEEIKLHKYRQQLMFYKILVENSRDYASNTVENAVLEFVEQVNNDKVQSLAIDFSDKGVREELDRFKKLIVSVYNKITMLDFPDTSRYEQSLQGIKEFEEDLITGKV
jgi:DNA helicase II / ATP-dependent DNA helicase PcrA